MELTDEQEVLTGSRRSIERSIERYQSLADEAFVIHRAIREDDAIRDFEFEYCNPAAARLFGRPIEHLRGSRLLQAYPQFEHDPFVFPRYAAVVRLGLVEEASVDHPLGIAGLKQHRRIAALGGDRIAVSHRDISREIRAHDQLELLVQEMGHRSRNQFALVQAICNHTLDQSESLAEFGEAFSKRIAALASAEVLHRPGGHLRLADLVQRVLNPFSHCPLAVRGDKQIAISDSIALPLSLILHELGTNATKHGCWKDRFGHLEIAWRAAGRLMEIEWTEHREADEAATGLLPGHGLRMIERAVASLPSGRISSLDRNGSVHHLITFHNRAIGQE